ncbi:MAG: energy-coupling factor transporter transmembrane protein EcfT [Lachnospiraceae bacterium]|nr:energy-coupling factor transporter transmembrane protein EcfT [Lachnospiraceae bacterium]
MELGIDRDNYISVDPRTKMLLLVVFTLIGFRSTDIWIHCGMFTVMVLLMINGRLFAKAAKMFVVFALTLVMDHFADVLIPGGAQAVHIVAKMIRLFMPAIMGFSVMISTVKVSEFIAAFERMHLPDEVTIPFSVMFRFFPTIKEEWNDIRSAMAFRGLGFTMKNLLLRTSLIYECSFVPLLADTALIADELSAAALCRGLGANKKRTYMADVRLRPVDFLLVTVAVLLTVFEFVL